MFDTSIEKFVVGNAGFQTAQKIGSISTRALTKLTAIQMDAACAGVETSLAQPRLLSDIRNYNDLYSLESGLTRQFYDQFMKMSEQSTDLLLESGNEFFEVIEDMFSGVQTGPVDVTKSSAPTKTTEKSVKPSKKASAKISTKAKPKSKKTPVKRTVAKKKSK